MISRISSLLVIRRSVFGFLAAISLAGAASQQPGSLVFPPYGHSYGIRKATPKHLFMFFGPATEFNDPQGIATAKMQSRDDPTTAKDDDEVVVYGVNAGRHQLIYNTTMWTLALYGTKGGGKDQFFHPRGIAINADGDVFVADSGNNRVVRLFNPKREVEWVAAWTGKSADDAGLKGPSQVGVTSDKRIYVTDTGNRRIVAFDMNGRIIVRIPGHAEFAFENGPATLAVADGRERWSYFNNERFVVCADRDGRRLWKIALDGVVLKTVDLPSGCRAGYAAADFYHNIWVTVQDRHCILKYDHALALLDRFGSYGTGDNQFVEPRGITIWKRYGQTFVAEKTGAQYYWIGTSLTSQSLTKENNGRYDLRLVFSEYSYISLFRPAGKNDTAWIMRKRFVYPGGASEGIEDRRGLIGMPGAPVLLRFEPTYSSHTYYWWDVPVLGK
jgi:DNA-binding beta-propeller fold protein YncE